MNHHKCVTLLLLLLTVCSLPMLAKMLPSLHSSGQLLLAGNNGTNDSQLLVAEGNKQLLEAQLKVANLETEKAELNAKKIQAELNTMKLQKEMDAMKQEKNGEVKICELQEQRIGTLEAHVALMNAKLQERAKNPLIRYKATKWSPYSVWKVVNETAWRTTTSESWGSVRTVTPFRDATPGNRSIFYFENLIVGNDGLRIGLSGRDFRLEGQCVGCNGTDSFAVSSDGFYWASGKKQEKDAPQGFGRGDVIGCGLVVMPTGSRHIFFTKNGENWVKPILLGPDEAKGHLFPTVSAYKIGNMVVANFGADLVAKPFLYDLSQLEVIDERVVKREFYK